MGCEVDNVLIELDGPETPIMDGSSIVFVESIEKAGRKEQKADREYYTLPQNVHYPEPDRKVEMVAMPQYDYLVTVMVEYTSQVLGSQLASIMHIDRQSRRLNSSHYCAATIRLAA